MQARSDHRIDRSTGELGRVMIALFATYATLSRKDIEGTLSPRPPPHRTSRSEASSQIHTPNFPSSSQVPRHPPPSPLTHPHAPP